jgi:mannitol/fructose-specific phosphotransferase system IIA component (Ntr-type)
MKLCELLDSAVIKLNLAATEREEAIEELVDVLVRAGRITDRKGCIEALMAREAQQTTGIGNAVGVPHAKHPCITKLTAALGISQKGVEFEAVDDKPAKVIFLIMARMNDPGPHVRALAEIARLLQIPGFFRKLVEAKSSDDVLAAIAAEE